VRRFLFPLLSAVVACCPPPPEPVTPKTPEKAAPSTMAKAPPAPASPLDTRPALAAAKDFAPPPPEVWKTEQGITVWLVARKTLPLVSATWMVPVGSSADPPDKPGLAHITADLLDEGAGKRGALQISTDLMDLGASFGIQARADGTSLSLVVLKKNFGEAFGIVADVLARPKLDATEWKRVQDLWKNRLKKRGDDPEAVASLVSTAAVYGPGTAYGHPVEGMTKASAKVDLAAVKDFYASHYRAEGMVLVVAGDVTRADVDALVKSGFGGWKGGQSKSKLATAPTSSAAASPLPRAILVDREDAPQAVVLVAKPGVTGSDPKLPLLQLVNTALGGSFTSRLNQNLREDHGWTYGARSGFSERRGQGLFTARAAVETGVTGPALGEMLKELELMAKKGLSADELAKVRAQDRGDLVQTYEAVEDASERLAYLAMAGRAPTWDADASRVRQAATLAELNALAAQYVDPKTGVIVVVGPKKEVLPALQKAGITDVAMWSEEGEPLK
jgi:zinc protease